MLETYLPVLIFIVIGAVVGAAMIGLGFALSPNRPDSEKNSPYECGFEAFEDSRMKFDVRYYLVAILFILFLLGPSLTPHSPYAKRGLEYSDGQLTVPPSGTARSSVSWRSTT